jgi:hypothetical protein
MSETNSATCCETGRSFTTSEAARASEQRFQEIQAVCAAGRVPELHPGDVIYLDTEIYLGRGRDDFCGGLAEVTEFSHDVRAPGSTPFVVVAQKQSQYNWTLLAAKQQRLHAKFGNTWSHPDPDYGPEFNEDWH